jgi:hypothetical protein
MKVLRDKAAKNREGVETKKTTTTRQETWAGRGQAGFSLERFECRNSQTGLDIQALGNRKFLLETANHIAVFCAFRTPTPVSFEKAIGNIIGCGARCPAPSTRVCAVLLWI